MLPYDLTNTTKVRRQMLVLSERVLTVHQRCKLAAINKMPKFKTDYTRSSKMKFETFLLFCKIHTV